MKENGVALCESLFLKHINTQQGRLQPSQPELDLFIATYLVHCSFSFSLRSVQTVLKCSMCVAVASYSLKVVVLFYLKGIT